jgi:hypothetical protein
MGGCCDSGHILRIYGVSRRRRIVQEYWAFPKWWGIADFVLAFVLAAMVFAVMVAAHGK